MTTIDKMAIAWSIGIVAAFVGLAGAGESIQDVSIEVNVREQQKTTNLSDSEKDLNDYLNKIRTNPQSLADFFEKMPKGADLHNHLAGNTQPEILIEIASQDNLCVNLDTAHVVRANLDFRCPKGTEFVSNAYDNQTLYEFLLKNWSIYKFDENFQKTGHDHFFDVFGKISEINRNVPAILGHWKIAVQEQNMQYMETMFNDPYIGSNIIENISSQITISNPNDFQDAYDIIKMKLDEAQIIENSVENIQRYEIESTEFCKKHSQYSCDIPFNYIYQVLRKNNSNEQVFSTMVIGFETIKQSDLFVAINMVQEEDSSIARQKYDIHMEMLNFLKTKYPEAYITLHAGELWHTLPGIDADEMSSHIYDAILTGKAQRIGHGVDIETEIDRFPNLLDIMQQTPIPVEINLNSNFVILEIKPEEHPIQFYLENDIPVMLSTDDQGILLSNTVNEFVTAAIHYPILDYYDFKEIIRNSLEYSFLPGKSLWENSEYKTKLPQCEPNTESQNCWIVDVDKKAALQHELELEFEKFENEN